ncbi:MAG: hypothetical protein RI883_2577 [Bacteroidota bacterium]|jgi:hypothetical protein
MKKMFLIAGITLLSLGAKAQVTVDGTDLNNLDIKYIEMVGQSKILSMSIKIAIDYGQDFSWKAQTVKSADGKTAAFNSIVDALNFLDANGWEYVNNYVIQSTSGEVTHRYLLKKKDK